MIYSADFFIACLELLHPISFFFTIFIKVFELFYFCRLESSFRSFSRPVLHAAARVVQEMGKSRAAAYALGAYDVDEGIQFNTYAENIDSIDSDQHESQPEGIF